jgi:head-tail adaptor
MSMGKMCSFIEIVSHESFKDSEGFTTNGDVILASVRAYKEFKHGSEAWKSRAVFSTATTLFRFRWIPGLTVTTAMAVICGGEKYNIVSVENVRDRNMFIEILTDKITPSER